MDTLLVIVGIVVYLLPGMIASIREHHSKFAIWALNVIFGWTFLGWIAAFIWSLASSGRQSENNKIIDATKKCPFCAEDIKSEAIICRFCNRDLKQ